MVDYLREFTSQGCDTFLFRSDDEDGFPGHHGGDKDDWKQHLKIIASVPKATNPSWQTWNLSQVAQVVHV